MIITAKMNRDFGACYSDKQLYKLYGPDGKRPDEVATLRDREWSDVSLCDRIWILQRVLKKHSRSGWLEYLARLTERALSCVENPDSRSTAVISALRSDNVKRSNVCDAANAYSPDDTDASAYAATTAAADAAVTAATNASVHADDASDYAATHAEDATYVYADDAHAEDERQLQLNDLVELILEGDVKKKSNV